MGWIPAIVVLASTRFRANRDIRFHAFQGLYLFVAWLLVDWFVTPLVIFRSTYRTAARHRAASSQLVIFGAWIFMLVKTSQTAVLSACRSSARSLSGLSPNSDNSATRVRNHPAWVTSSH